MKARFQRPLEFILIFLSITTSSFSFADQLFLSTDPVPYFENGYQVRGGGDIGKFRFSTFSSKSDRPIYTKAPGNEVDATSKATGAEVIYIGKTTEGSYWGIIYEKVRWIYKDKATGARVTRDGDLVGGKFGYRYFIGKYFFMDASMQYTINAESSRDLTLAGRQYEISSTYVFPFFEIGIGI